MLPERTLERLHAEGARAMEQNLARRGWALVTTPAVEARAFWATVLGVVLQLGARAGARPRHRGGGDPARAQPPPGAAQPSGGRSGRDRSSHVRAGTSRGAGS